MSLCVAVAGSVIAFATGGFTLEWEHSVARTRWWERWEVSEAGLRPVEARIEGSGAGMEVPEGAILRDGAWHYTPSLSPLSEIVLAASGMTGGGWRLCVDGTCLDLPEADPSVGDRSEGDQPKSGAPLRLWQAADCQS